MRWHASPRDGLVNPWDRGLARPGQDYPRTSPGSSRSTAAFLTILCFGRLGSFGGGGGAVTVQCHLLLSKGRLCAGASARLSCPAFLFLFAFFLEGVSSFPFPTLATDMVLSVLSVWQLSARNRVNLVPFTFYTVYFLLSTNAVPWGTNGLLLAVMDGEPGACVRCI